MNRKRIAVVGSSNTDMILKLARIPKAGETIIGGEYFSAPGGKGANQAVAAARTGGSVTFIAKVGQDVLGDQAVAGFKREGIDVTHVSRDPIAASGVALIFIDGKGENSIGVAGGANNRLSVDDVKLASPALRSSGVVLLQLETPLASVKAAAAEAAAAGAQVILNPAPACALPDDLLGQVTYLTPNEHEAAMLAGVEVTDQASAAKAASILLTKGPKAVIITMGAAGAYVHTPSGGQMIPSFPVKAVDTTAAGDTFNGAFAVALAEGLPLHQAVRFGNAAAAISVTRMGAQPSVPTRAEVDALLKG